MRKFEEFSHVSRILYLPSTSLRTGSEAPNEALRAISLMYILREKGVKNGWFLLILTTDLHGLHGFTWIYLAWCSWQYLLVKQALSQILAFIHKAIEMAFFRSRLKTVLVSRKNAQKTQRNREKLDRITGLTEILYLPADADLAAAFSIPVSAKPAASVHWAIRMSRIRICRLTKQDSIGLVKTVDFNLIKHRKQREIINNFVILSIFVAKKA